MTKIYLIICVLVLYNFENINCKKTCKENNDCVTIQSCPEAANLAKYRKTNETINKKFISSICGMMFDKGRPSIQVCCSDFQEKIRPNKSGPTLSVRGASTQSDENDDYTNHSNIGLLPENCGKYVEDRIVGGDFAAMYEFPWMTLISFIEQTVTGTKVDFGCGGTIINSKYILTAAHCVSNKVIGGVRVGEYDIRTETDCEGEYNLVCESYLQNLAIEKKIVHENFHLTPQIINDIALIRVKGEIKFGKQNVGPICLPIYKELVQSNLIGKKVTVAGWGITETGSRSMILKKVSIQVRSNNRPKKIITAGDSGSDSCQGDSGGPLMYSGEYNNTMRFIQYGIVSNGPTLCGSTHPAAYTDVRRYMRWILDNIEP